MEIEGAEPEFPIRIISFCSFAIPIIVFTHGWLAFTESFLSRAWSSMVTGLSLLYFSRVHAKWKTPPVKLFWWEILFLAILRIVDACNVTRFNTSIQLLSFGLQMFSSSYSLPISCQLSFLSLYPLAYQFMSVVQQERGGQRSRNRVANQSCLIVLLGLAHRHINSWVVGCYKVLLFEGMVVCGNRVLSHVVLLHCCSEMEDQSQTVLVAVLLTVRCGCCRLWQC
uniref:Uncharacterized protein n=1 Tax=Nelumbo nucifera TaxID=4432 RepID=A0A822YSJ5_NELNU|nr:TPA_asm: hypothetical protein HUJ06_005713 [Nelumbo nucifera]